MRHSRWFSRKRKEYMWGYVFILPWLVGLIIFKLGPLFFSFVISWYQWNIVSSAKFVGLSNYRNIISDKLFWKSTLNTLYFWLNVPIGLILALLIAMLLNKQIKGISVFRAIIYLPAVTAGVVVGVLWVWILHPHYGVINSILNQFGVQGPPWLSSPDWAMPSLLLLKMFYIGPPMVILLAGLQGIPAQLYEAAEMDGAGRLTKFVHVTLPMLSPTILFCILMYTVESLSRTSFALPYVMTRGGPVNATLTYVLYLYNNAFMWFKMGYASALSWVFALAVFLIILVQLRLSRRWVYYAGRV